MGLFLCLGNNYTTSTISLIVPKVTVAKALYYFIFFFISRSVLCRADRMGSMIISSFTGGEMQAQRGAVTSLVSHSWMA